MTTRFTVQVVAFQFLLRLGMVAGSFFVAQAVAAQTSASGGTVEGRVSHAGNGNYLENVRVIIDGTRFETFTDATGTYRFSDVPAGPVKLRAFFTGFEEQMTAVSVGPGATVQHDIALGSSTVGPDGARQPLTLSRYVVAEKQPMEGAAIAINEQRFAPNLKTVVTADEFGAASEGDVGELLKYLPGVSMEYLAGDARQVSLGGVDFNYTPITFGGFGMTNGNQGGTNRGVSLEYMSLNNVSRIEVINSPTPESPGSALAGSINFVPRTAFERARPQLTFSTYISMRDDARDFEKSVGPREQRTRKVRPGFEFSYVVPVNNGNTFPDTTPDRPYLSNHTFRDGFLMRKRSSVSLTADYKLGDHDRVSFSITRSSYNTNYDIRALIFAIDRVQPAPAGFGPTFTRGAAGMGTLTVNTEVRDRNTTTFMPTLVYRHDGPTWKIEGGAGYSHSRDSTQSGDRGFFSTTSSRRAGVTINFDDVTAHRPGRVTVTDGATGAVVDPFDINTYVVATAQYTIPQNSDAKRSLYGNIRRDLDWRQLPFSFKAGFDLQNAVRDDTRSVYPFNVLFDFVGVDGVTSSAPVRSDDLASRFFYDAIASRPGVFGFPSIPVVSSTKLWTQYKTTPAEFRSDDNTTFRNSIMPNKRAEETISAMFVRGDVQLFARRLKLVGGLRAEQTNVSAEGPLTDVSRNHQRRPDGSLILGANGRPLPIIANTNSLAYSQLTLIPRGARAEKEYLRWFPSLNASFNLRTNLIGRVSYYQSIGRPNFNQYASGITLPDPEADPSASNRITVNNAGIKPWSADTIMGALEYYFSGVGIVSVSAYRRNFENFFGNVVVPVTPEFLELYSLDPAQYGEFTVSTQHNIADTVRMDGFSFNYKQALTFLPEWARGIQIFANGTTQHASGGARGEFQYSPRLANAGISLTRKMFSVRIDYNHRGRQLVSTLAGRGIQADTTRYAAPRDSIDITGEHVLWRQLRLFAKLRNVTDVGVDFEMYGPATPDYARFQQRERYGALWTFGLKGTF
jgi:iron complex outermembrane receptor protein